jgi:hypothetical protein
LNNYVKIHGDPTETALVLFSKIPLFIVGPDAQVPRRIPEILYLTDFSDSSELALQRVLDLAVAARFKHFMVVTGRFVNSIHSRGFTPFGLQLQ